MDRLYGLIVFVLGIMILWLGRGLFVGNLRAPGPGFFPILLAATLIFLSLFLILPKGKKREETERAPLRARMHVITVSTALLAYFFLIEPLGFMITSFFFMTFLFLLFTSHKRCRAPLLGAVTTALAYLLFETFLKGNLPKGLLGF